MKKIYKTPKTIITELYSEVSFLAGSDPDEGRNVTGGGPEGTIDVTTGGGGDDDSGETT